MRLATFGGPKDSERRHVAFMGNGPKMSVDFSEGPASGNNVTHQRQLRDNGEVRFYDGDIDHPLLRRVVTPAGEVRFYTGDVPHHETLERVVTPEGEVTLFYSPPSTHSRLRRCHLGLLLRRGRRAEQELLHLVQREPLPPAGRRVLVQELQPVHTRGARLLELLRVHGSVCKVHRQYSCVGVLLVLLAQPQHELQRATFGLVARKEARLVSGTPRQFVLAADPGAPGG